MAARRAGSYRAPADPFEVLTEDGVRLSGHRVGPAGRATLVFCHGFLGWHLKPRLVAFQEELSRAFTVYAVDLRGHGGSGGVSSFGAREHLDVEAVVRLAREEGGGPVVTFGCSMGGIAVIRHGGLLGGVDGVVAVSTPATWNGHETGAVRRLVWFTATATGRRLLRATGVRVGPRWERPADPVDLVDRIAPIPLWIVHGRDDHFFDEEDAWALYRRAGEPKRLFLASRFGHAEDGYTPAFAQRIARSVVGDLDRRGGWTVPRPGGAGPG